MSTSASGMLGVTTVAKGSRRPHKASTASARSNESPLLATITGSTTNLSTPATFSSSATVAMMLLLESMPVFTAFAPMSESTACIWAAMISTGTSWTAVTCMVFWAVMAVSTEAP